MAPSNLHEQPPAQASDATANGGAPLLDNHLPRQAQQGQGTGQSPATPVSAAPNRDVVSDDRDLNVRNHEPGSAKADAQIASLQTSISLLSALGAELASALEKRNRDYERLRLQVVTLLPDLTEMWPERSDARQDQPEPSSRLEAEMANLYQRLETTRKELAATAEQRDRLATQLRQREAQLEQLRTLFVTVQADLFTIHGVREDGSQSELEQTLPGPAQAMQETPPTTAESDLAGSAAEVDTLSAKEVDLQAHLDGTLAAESRPEAQVSQQEATPDALNQQLTATQEHSNASQESTLVEDASS
jgi:chromosome segregation ATPase